MSERRFGQWAGNEKGEAENRTRCIKEVWPSDGRWHSYQCLRKRGYGPNGEYCKQHAAKVKEENKEVDNLIKQCDKVIKQAKPDE